ncbi:MAG: DUF421 domain-containing protein [Geminicoccaceae bacterium]
MFWTSWTAIWHVLVVAPLAYLALVFFLRASGKRTLTKLNAFDLVVTVALGSTLATIILDRSTALAEGLLALFLLVALQYVITWASVRSPQVQDLVKSEPTLLLRRGRFLDRAMREKRVTREELQAVLRANGKADAEDVDAIVMETDGSFSVLSSVAEDIPGDLPLARTAPASAV